jgi:hypothetical protein
MEHKRGLLAGIVGMTLIALPLEAAEQGGGNNQIEKGGGLNQIDKGGGLNQKTDHKPGEGIAAARLVLTVDGVDVGAQVTGAMDILKTSLQGITDSASAQLTLPKLQEADVQLTKVNDLVAKLSPDQKKALASLAAAALPTLNQLFDKALELPGVGDNSRQCHDCRPVCVTAAAPPSST